MNQERFEQDRNRTIKDYYRLNLDKIENEKMVQACNAYMKNTPGSRKAIEDLINKHQNNQNDSKHEANNEPNKTLNESNNNNNSSTVETNA